MIIDRRLNLNFVTDDDMFKTPFLFIVINHAPHIELFDYFIDSGVKINFYDKDDEELQTCLDYIERKIEDTVLDDLEGYYYRVKENYSTILDNKVCIDKEDYEQLIAHSSILYNLRDTTILRNHILVTGGKSNRGLHRNN